MRQWRGFSLSLITAVLWGVLPVFLKICLQVMDSSTITWYRFLFAAIFVFVVLAVSRGLPNLKKVPVPYYWLLLVAGAALVVNYVANVEGLAYINPETVQILMQLAPFLLMLGGIVFFKERFNFVEGLGAVALITGLLLFFNQKLHLLAHTLNSFSIGVFLIMLAAVTWAGYALAQKVLLRTFTAKQLTLLIYGLGVVMLLPFANLDDLFALNTLQAWSLLFCCFNTVIAYGAFTEALNIWHASKVSAVIALSPLFTFLSMAMAVEVMPENFISSELDLWSYLGAIMVVCGSITASLAKGSANKN